MDKFLYFSGTGNSKYISEKFARVMKENYNQKFEVHSIEEKLDFGKLISDSGIIGFCYPIYGSSIPKIMREFIIRYRENLNGKKIIIFCTQLLFSGDGSRSFTDLIKNIDVEILLAEHFNMPNNVCNFSLLKIKNGEENYKKINKANKRLYKACYNLYSGKKKLRGFNAFSHFLGLFQRPGFLKMENDMRNKINIDENKCILCGLCVRECPTINLYMDDGKIGYKDLCTLCYRCVNHCPEKAITVWLSRGVVKQYKGPVI